MLADVDGAVIDIENRRLKKRSLQDILRIEPSARNRPIRFDFINRHQWSAGFQAYRIANFECHGRQCIRFRGLVFPDSPPAQQRLREILERYSETREVYVVRPGL